MTVKTMRTSAALGTAIALGLGGLLVGSTAANAQDSTDAPTTGTAYNNFAQGLLTDDSIQGVAQNGDGDITVLAVADADSAAAENAAATYDNVDVEWLDTPLTAYAATDIVGGTGYLVDSPEGSGACSIGFAAWTPAGAPALITAGHCLNDGTSASNSTNPHLSVPSQDPAVGGPGFVSAGTGSIGTFGFGQFGGTGNTVGVEGNKAQSLDIAVINAAAGFTPRPEITTWASAASNDLSTATTLVRAVGAPVVNKPVSKSGRTTGLTSDSSVDYVNGWYRVSGHEVYGAAIIGLTSAPGDSGGAIFQGTTAVGILSGGGTLATGENVVIAADLLNGLAHTGGYTVQLHVDAPAVTSPANGATITSGDTISGTGPASTDIVVTPSVGAPVTVRTNAQGKWSFVAATLGTVNYSLVAKNGFNVSAATAHTVTVQLGAPRFTTDVSAGKPSAITGTGVAGAVVTLTGDVTGTATVAADGTWSIPAQLAYGTTYAISATQALDGSTSPAQSSTLAVTLPKPAVTSPAHKATLDASPTSLAGTGVTDAVVTLTLDGESVSDTAGDEFPVVAGKWSAPQSATLAAGTHTIVVTQTIEGVSSSATSTFEIVAAGAGTGSGTGGDATLAHTGADAGLGLGLLAVLAGAGGTLLLVSQRRRAAAASTAVSAAV